MKVDNLVRAMLLLALALFAHSVKAVEKINIRWACTDSTWKNISTFADSCPYRVEADGTHTPVLGTKPEFGVFEVKHVGNSFEIVDVIWGKPPESKAFDLALLHNIMKNQSTDATLQLFYSAPRLDSPVEWKQLPKNGGGNNWFGIIPKSSLGKQGLKHLRRVTDVSGLHFIVMVNFLPDGEWGLPSQTHCDFMLVEKNRVFAPIYLGKLKPYQIWAHHPHGSNVSALKKLLAKTARKAHERRLAESCK